MIVFDIIAFTFLGLLVVIPAIILIVFFLYIFIKNIFNSKEDIIGFIIAIIFCLCMFYLNYRGY